MAVLKYFSQDYYIFFSDIFKMFLVNCLPTMKYFHLKFIFLPCKLAKVLVYVTNYISALCFFVFPVFCFFVN